MSKNEMITLPREVVGQAIRSLERYCFDVVVTKEVHAALRSALEQPKNHIEQHLGMVPAGWKLVPVEPKISMKQAALNASRRWAECDAPLPRTQELWASEVCWKAMVEAAPHPPTVKESLTVEQPQGEQESAPNGATHIQLQQGAFYKRVDGKWYVWSLMKNGEPRRWYISPGTAESCLKPLAATPKQKRQPLADEQIWELYCDWHEKPGGCYGFARAIETHHGIK